MIKRRKQQIFSFLAISLLFFPALSRAEYGLSPFALLSPHWPCAKYQEAIQSLPELRIALLWNTFGKDTSCYRQLLADKRLRAVEIHLINEPCHRNNRCGNYEFLSPLTLREWRKQVRERDPQLFQKLVKYGEEAKKAVIDPLPPNVECYVSPGLESNLSTTEGTILLEAMRPLFTPRCRLVWNPLRGEPVADALFEVHGRDTARAECIYNNDGTSLDPEEAKTFLPRHEQCRVKFYWGLGDNLNSRERRFLDPRQRTAFHSPDELSEIVEVVRELSSERTQERDNIQK